MQEIQEKAKLAKEKNAEKAVTELLRKENWAKLKADLLPSLVNQLDQMRRVMRKAGEQKLD